MIDIGKASVKTRLAGNSWRFSGNGFFVEIGMAWAADTRQIRGHYIQLNESQGRASALRAVKYSVV